VADLRGAGTQPAQGLFDLALLAPRCEHIGVRGGLPLVERPDGARGQRAVAGRAPTRGVVRELFHDSILCLVEQRDRRLESCDARGAEFAPTDALLQLAHEGSMRCRGLRRYRPAYDPRLADGHAAARADPQRLVGDDGRDVLDADACHAGRDLDHAASLHVRAVLGHGDCVDGGGHDLVDGHHESLRLPPTSSSFDEIFTA